MKRNLLVRIICIAIVLFGLLSVISCEKDNTDFRRAFVGQYQVEEKITCYGECFTCQTTRDTIIIVDYGFHKNTLYVLGREVELDSDGNYLSYHYSLHMSNDSLFSNYMNGGLGCGQTEIYKGIRISDETSQL